MSKDNRFTFRFNKNNTYHERAEKKILSLPPAKRRDYVIDLINRDIDRETHTHCSRSRRKRQSATDYPTIEITCPHYFHQVYHLIDGNFVHEGEPIKEVTDEEWQKMYELAWKAEFPDE